MTHASKTIAMQYAERLTFQQLKAMRQKYMADATVSSVVAYAERIKLSGCTRNDNYIAMKG